MKTRMDKCLGHSRGVPGGFRCCSGMFRGILWSFHLISQSFEYVRKFHGVLRGFNDVSGGFRGSLWRARGVHRPLGGVPGVFQGIPGGVREMYGRSMGIRR